MLIISVRCNENNRWKQNVLYIAKCNTQQDEAIAKGN